MLNIEHKHDTLIIITIHFFNQSNIYSVLPEYCHQGTQDSYCHPFIKGLSVLNLCNSDITFFGGFFEILNFTIKNHSKGLHCYKKIINYVTLNFYQRILGKNCFLKNIYV